MALEFKGDLKAVDFINTQESFVKSSLLKITKLMAQDADTKMQDILQMGLADFMQSLKNFKEKYKMESDYSSFLGQL